MKSENYQNFNILSFDELKSTNETAKEMALNGEIKQDSVITCDIQTSGKGRLDRKWTSDPENLHFSLVFRPQIDLDKLNWLVFVAINALKEVVSEENQAKVKKKWPNDLLINDKKVAGILLESLISDNKCDFVIIGIGVNIATNPQNTIFPASNLADEGFKVNKSEFLHQFLDKFNQNYQDLLDFGPKKVKNKYIEDAWKLNQEITVNSQNEENSGIFVGINDGGDIMLQLENGSLTEISIGDVS